MIQIETNNLFAGKFDAESLQKAAESVLVHEAASNSEMTIAIEEDPVLQDLNSRFLGIDAPTDVLSFPAEEINPETGLVYLGDIIISYSIAEAQAQAAGHDTNAELQLLVVHGTLHLLGYDHATREEKASMWKAQNEILTQIDCKLTKLPD